MRVAQLIFRLIAMGILLWVLAFWAATLVRNAHAATWSETWQVGLGNWESVTGGVECSTLSGGRLTMVCESGALRSLQSWDNHTPISAEVTAACSAAVGKTFWCGLTLWGKENAAPDVEYAEIELSSDDGAGPGGRGKPQVSALIHWPYFTGKVADYTPGTTKTLKLLYDGAGRLKGFVDGVKKLDKPWDSTQPIRIELLTVCVGEQMSSSCRAKGVYGPLTVKTGTDAIPLVP